MSAFVSRSVCPWVAWICKPIILPQSSRLHGMMEGGEICFYSITVLIAVIRTLAPGLHEMECGVALFLSPNSAILAGAGDVISQWVVRSGRGDKFSWRSTAAFSAFG